MERNPSKGRRQRDGYSEKYMIGDFMDILDKLLLPVLIFFSLSACAGTYEQDSEIMINRLLHIDNEKYMTKTESGEYFYNSLLEYKEWENLYIKYSKYGDKNKIFTKPEIKKLLFIGYISKTNLDAAISESFSSDLVPIYNENTNMVVNVLSQLKFLIPSTCYYLSQYFGFEGKNIDKKQSFIDKNTPILLRELGEEEGKLCLSYLTG